MKILTCFEGMLLGCAKKPWDYQGRSGINYTLSIEYAGEVDNVKCTEQVYDRVRNGDFAKFAECEFSLVSDSRYKKVYIDDLAGK